MTVGGHDVVESPLEAKRLVGYLPESAAAYPDMSVEGFLEFTAELRGLHGDARKKAVARAAERCFRIAGMDPQPLICTPRICLEVMLVLSVDDIFIANGCSSNSTSWIISAGWLHLMVDVVGDISRINLTQLNLQAIGSNLYGPPTILSVVRDGDKVTVTWEQIEMTNDKDRGYFWELFVCQNGNYLWWTDSYPDQFTTSFSVTDEAGCSEPSQGQLYTVEKHGYSFPVDIPWPKP